MAVVTIKDLLEAGVHFGHKTRRWNPKMKSFIFEARDGIYIIDLQKTMEQLQEASQVIRERVLRGASVLFVGTKKQAKDAVERAGKDTKMHFVTERWLGGTLTNNVTIRQSIKRLRYLDGLFEDGTAEHLPKKEISTINRERSRLHKNLDGIREMNGLPGVVFVVDPKRERIVTSEARKLGIPLIGVCDTNCDPDDVDFPIPANDDAIKSVSLIVGIVSQIVQEAMQEREKLGIKIEEKPDFDESMSNDDSDGRQQRRPARRKRPPRPTGGRRPRPEQAAPAQREKPAEEKPAPKPEAVEEVKAEPAPEVAPVEEKKPEPAPEVKPAEEPKPEQATEPVEDKAPEAKEESVEEKPE